MREQNYQGVDKVDKGMGAELQKKDASLALSVDYAPIQERELEQMHLDKNSPLKPGPESDSNEHTAHCSEEDLVQYAEHTVAEDTALSSGRQSLKSKTATSFSMAKQNCSSHVTAYSSKPESQVSSLSSPNTA